MRFLITNDDGIGAPGLELLARVAAEFGEVQVVAPAKEQSGISHRVTFEKPLVVSQLNSGIYSVAGTPADCVRVAVTMFDNGFDWVLAGINDGSNLGIDVFYSGTVAAAREATFFDIPAMALSQYRRKFAEPFDWVSSEELVRKLLHDRLGSNSNKNTLVNINLPDRYGNAEAEKIKIVECEVDMSPLPPNYEQTNDGLVTNTRYSQRPRKTQQDIDVCFNGDVSVSYL